MAKKLITSIGLCIVVILTISSVEPAGATATDDRAQGHNHSTSQRQRKARKKGVRRGAVSYVCPMHPDVRSKSAGTCPKCLMELVRKETKPARR